MVGLVVGGALLSFLAVAGGSRALAEEIYKWTDAQGRTHYSNRGATASEAPGGGADSGKQGWESVLERQQGSEAIQQKSEAAINNLELQMVRRKRDRALAQEELEATQASLVRSAAANPSQVPALRAREATQAANLRRIEAEIMTMEMNIAKIRAFRDADKEQRTGR